MEIFDLSKPIQVDGLEALNLLKIFWIPNIVLEFLIFEVILPWKYPNPVWYFSIIDEKTFYEEDNGFDTFLLLMKKLFTKKTMV